MAEISTYVFSQSNLRGNFMFANLCLLFDDPFSWTVSTTNSSSVLTVTRATEEFLINLYERFNRPDFLYLLDIAPEIGGVSMNANAGALMVLISTAMSHYAYRTSDIRAGWNEWRYVPYHDKDPARHQDSDLLNQIAFNFHVTRGVGTVDNDGWIAFYYMFSLDGAGRLRAFVDGCGYQFGGGNGLPDGGQDLGAVLDSVLPSFFPTIQSFLDSFCSIADLFSSGVHDSDGYPLFDQFYLLPGDGNPLCSYPTPLKGNGARSVDVEVSLALLPKQKMLPSPPGPGIPTQIVTEVAHALRDKGWSVKVSEAGGICDLKGRRVTDGRNIEIDVHLSEAFRKVSNAFEIKRPMLKKANAAKKKTKKP